ncbi:protein SMAX1-LIKE 4-like [Oryza brachyantha]|uniref:protein SMAX1-LIKE 4-like n=1 Tax=Oryza brachyantha TaxID=4533 RepID=UPI001ADC889D|nr:protein SMAX1-LIKE 4-like [Oryza brachyantha]
MRAGVYTVHQALSADAAAVLKLALALARCRGHAQLTPLHVAFTLLRSSSSSSDPAPFACSGDASSSSSSCCAYGLLRRACVRAHPAVAACAAAAMASHSHPLQCRALELCFNVALNRLPTANAMPEGGRLCSPASSTSTLSASLAQPPDPTLSNALVAALKRAQANQRRGCIELQSLQAQQQSSQQPLLAIKVELDQLVISILDDPSVSRVMREAGFSSAAVKTSLEEEGAMLPSIGHHICYSSSSPASCVSPVFSHDPHIDFNASGAGSSWPAQFLHHPGTGSSCEEDVSAILEVMMRKQGARTNPVVVGDSVSVADALVAELMRRLNTGDVPDELRGVHVLSLHLSCVHLRLMTRADVDAQVAELRRTANSIADDKAAGLVIYVGDLRWAIDDDGDQALADHSTSEDHMVTELARLLAELRAASRGRAWLVAAASYQTYMRCQQRRRRRAAPSLEAAWSLQPVVVPADAGTSLALGRRAPLAPAPSREGEDGKTTKLGEISMVDVASGEDGGVPAFCADCADGYEKEASLVKAKAEGTTLALTYFPGWPQANEPLTSHKAELMELRRKWGSLCQRVHCHRLKHQASIASPLPWWCTSVGRRDVEERAEWNPTSPGLRLSFGTPAGHGRSESADEQGQSAGTALSLLLPDSAATAAATTCHDTCARWSDGGVDGERAVQGSDAHAAADDAVSTGRRLWLDDLLLSGDLQRKAEEENIIQLPGGPKRRRGNISLDLNLCASTGDDDDDGGDSEEEEAAPSDLTNEGGSDGLDSHE